MSEDKQVVVNNGQTCGCCSGCIVIVIFILMFWALVFGLPINGKILNIDIFPPAINYKAAPIVEVEKTEAPSTVVDFKDDE